MQGHFGWVNDFNICSGIDISRPEVQKDVHYKDKIDKVFPILNLSVVTLSNIRKGNFQWDTNTVV